MQYARDRIERMDEEDENREELMEGIEGGGGGEEGGGGVGGIGGGVTDEEMNQDESDLCRVCGEKISRPRVHYGGITCYSCRAFFR